jgi:hypothetical protein
MTAKQVPAILLLTLWAAATFAQVTSQPNQQRKANQQVRIGGSRLSRWIGPRDKSPRALHYF